MTNNLRRNIGVLLLSSLVLLQISCKTLHQTAGYSFGNEFFDSSSEGKHMFGKGYYISYDNYLFEFVTTRYDSSKLMSDGELQLMSSRYDIHGVYVLAPGNKFYIQFDKFALDGKIIKTGELIHKPSGESLPIQQKDTNQYKGLSIKDTVMYGEHYCFVDTSGVINELEDTVESRVFLVKDRHLNSIYKVYGCTFPLKEYCVVGVSYYLRNKQVNTMDIAKNFQPLTAEQIKICAALIERQKHAVTDTITIK